jgi:hypothetical protein
LPYCCSINLLNFDSRLDDAMNDDAASVSLVRIQYNHQAFRTNGCFDYLLTHPSTFVRMIPSENEETQIDRFVGRFDYSINVTISVSNSLSAAKRLLVGSYSVLIIFK